jgi:hypothetical protein
MSPKPIYYGRKVQNRVVIMWLRGGTFDIKDTVLLKRGFQWNPKDKRWWIAADRAYATELLNEISATGAKVVPDDEMPSHLAIVGYGYAVREEMK